MKCILKYIIPALLLSTVLLCCAPLQWLPVTQIDTEISWPPPPDDPKVRYVGRLTGFHQEGQTLSTLLFGKSNQGQIIKPVAIVRGHDDRLAIADQGRHGVHLYLPAGYSYRFIDEADGESLQSPVGVAFDDEGQLYVTESVLGKILVYDNQGNFQSAITMAGNEMIKRPTGIVFNAHDQQLYVSDTLSHQILVFNKNGHFVSRLSGRGETLGTLNFPTHLSCDQQGNLYIVDSMNFRAQIYSPQTMTWQMFGRHGNGTGDFASPKGIDVDKNGIIYISETLFDTVQLFDNTGRYLLAVGSQGNGPGQFSMPSGLTIDKKDRLYVCDTYNKRIQVFQIISDR